MVTKSPIFKSPVFKSLVGVEVKVWLSPGAAKNAVGEVLDHPEEGAVLKASVRAVPEKNKANKALIEMLAQQWGLPKRALSLIKGQKSRFKIIAVEGNPDELERKLIQQYHAS